MKKYIHLILYYYFIFYYTHFESPQTFSMANVGLLKGMKSIPKQESHLAGGWSAILFSLQGDSDYFSNALGLPRWQVNRNCCALLMQLVPKVGINSPNAPWIATLWTPAEWRASPTSTSAMFKGIPGSSAFICSFDFMHNKYLAYLGCDQYSFGSCMCLWHLWLQFLH